MCCFIIKCLQNRCSLLIHHKLSLSVISFVFFDSMSYLFFFFIIDFLRGFDAVCLNIKPEYFLSVSFLSLRRYLIILLTLFLSVSCSLLLLPMIIKQLHRKKNLYNYTLYNIKSIYQTKPIFVKIRTSIFTSKSNLCVLQYNEKQHVISQLTTKKTPLLHLSPKFLP